MNRSILWEIRIWKEKSRIQISKIMFDIKFKKWELHRKISFCPYKLLKQRKINIGSQSKNILVALFCLVWKNFSPIWRNHILIYIYSQINHFFHSFHHFKNLVKLTFFFILKVILYWIKEKTARSSSGVRAHSNGLQIWAHLKRANRFLRFAFDFMSFAGTHVYSLLFSTITQVIFIILVKWVYISQSYFYFEEYILITTLTLRALYTLSRKRNWDSWHNRGKRLNFRYSIVFFLNLFVPDFFQGD